MKLLYFGAVIAAAGLLLGSCQHEVLPKVNASDICFERDVLPIFVSNCAMSGCHVLIPRKDGVILTDCKNIIREVNVKSPYSSFLYKCLEKKYFLLHN
jgi:hypothetical protein